MNQIFALCHDFQIIDSIVGFVSVLVIDRHCLRDRTEKSDHDKSMNQERSLLALSRKVRLAIAQFIDLQLAQSISCVLGIGLDAPHAAKVADVVDSFITDNSFPFFTAMASDSLAS